MDIHSLHALTKSRIASLFNQEVEDACSAILTAANNGNYSASITKSRDNSNVEKIVEAIQKRYPDIYWYKQQYNSHSQFTVTYTFSWDLQDDDADLEDEEDYSDMPELIPFK